MAKNDDAEEKSLPPSRVKLDRLRREGQVARSKELPVAVSVVAIALYLSWALGSVIRDFAHVFDLGFQALQSAEARARPELQAASLREMGQTLLGIVWPPLLLGLAVVFVVSIIDAQGLPASMKHMRIDFSRLNPAEGFKKLFSLSSLVEFLKGAIKLALLVVTGTGVLLYFLNAIFWSPVCGEACSLSVAVHLVGTIAIIAAGIMLLAAFVDIRISRALFRREHRMTKTEARREHKETQGDPHMKSARRQVGAEMRNAPPRRQGPAGG
ncbi:Type III secretion inner membrane protein (plasmid) [Sinorhizobium sojae CCBAU 05684]|uniref:Type III secretion inner membrane protein n=1 Tax=Sinorhizobium sojae CCBAU 05684 TaxID=716928 RepID=A0A249PIJ7_9HYPH|nr:EscU/YscU/HrcU family type III secretion system export apparatus switch protein [Sinorhizobium sojae]ASY65738.1 Type III secretion inner membrane protein [Sinorhizobium sojae CCBAU 05684]